MRRRESIKPRTSSGSIFKVADLCCKVSRANIYAEVDGMVSQAGIYHIAVDYGRLRIMYILPMQASYILRVKDCLQHLASRDSSLALTIINLHPVLTIRNLHV